MMTKISVIREDADTKRRGFSAIDAAEG